MIGKKIVNRHKCQCPYNSPGCLPESMYSPEELIGRIHEPKKCNCTNDLRLYERDGKRIWLCSCCCMPEDIEIELNRRRRNEHKRCKNR